MTSSSPNDDDDSVISDDLVNTYCIRVTPDDAVPFTMGDIKKYLDSTYETDSWVVAREEKPKTHFHIVLQTYDDLKTVRKSLTETFLYMYWPVRERGWGNKQYNLKVSVTPLEALSYALKEKVEYIFHGYEQGFIDERIEASFQKNKPSNFKLEYHDLVERFQSSDMDTRTFMILFITLKAKYGQQVRLTDAFAYANSNAVLRDPTFADNLVEDFLYKQ